MSSLLWLAGLLGLAWLWFDGRRAHEYANLFCQQLCRQRGLRLLDGTISLRQMRLYRSADQRQGLWGWQWQRQYQFDFSSDIQERAQGSVTIRGTRPVFIDLPEQVERVVIADNDLAT